MSNNFSNIPPNIIGYNKKTKLDIGPTTVSINNILSYPATPFSTPPLPNFSGKFDPSKDFMQIIPNTDRGDNELNKIQVLDMVTAVRPDKYGGPIDLENLTIFHLRFDKNYLLDITTLNCMLACEPELRSIKNEKEIMRRIIYMGVVRGKDMVSNDNVNRGRKSGNRDYPTLSVQALGRTMCKNFWGKALHGGQILGFEVALESVKNKVYVLSKNMKKNCDYDGYAYQLKPKISSSKYGDPYKDTIYELPDDDEEEIHYKKFIYTGVPEQRTQFLPHPIDVNDHMSVLNGPLIEFNVCRKSTG